MKMFEQISSTMGSQRDEVILSMTQKMNLSAHGVKCQPAANRGTPGLFRCAPELPNGTPDFLGCAPEPFRRGKTLQKPLFLAKVAAGQGKRLDLTSEVMK